MKKISFFLYFNLLFGQSILNASNEKKVLLENGEIYTTIEDSLSQYVSKNKAFIFQYDSGQWERIKDSKWDLEINSISDVITARFHQTLTNYTFKNIKKIIQGEYKNNGKVKDFIVTEKTINQMSLIYYEFRIRYKKNDFYYAGIAYSSSNGSFQLIVGGQKWLFDLNNKLINDVITGVRKNY